MSGGRIAVRDSKDTAGPILLFGSSEWRTFVGAVKNGGFYAIMLRAIS
jgi:Domain of unknown function (DUF397)